MCAHLLWPDRDEEAHEPTPAAWDAECERLYAEGDYDGLAKRTDSCWSAPLGGAHAAIAAASARAMSRPPPRRGCTRRSRRARARRYSSEGA